MHVHCVCVCVYQRELCQRELCLSASARAVYHLEPHGRPRRRDCDSARDHGGARDPRLVVGARGSVRVRLARGLGLQAQSAAEAPTCLGRGCAAGVNATDRRPAPALSSPAMYHPDATSPPPSEHDGDFDKVWAESSDVEGLFGFEAGRLGDAPKSLVRTAREQEAQPSAVDSPAAYMFRDAWDACASSANSDSNVGGEEGPGADDIGNSVEEGPAADEIAEEEDKEKDSEVDDIAGDDHNMADDGGEEESQAGESRKESFDEEADADIMSAEEHPEADSDDITNEEPEATNSAPVNSPIDVGTDWGAFGSSSSGDEEALQLTKPSNAPLTQAPRAALNISASSTSKVRICSQVASPASVFKLPERVHSPTMAGHPSTPPGCEWWFDFAVQQVSRLHSALPDKPAQVYRTEHLCFGAGADAFVLQAGSVGLSGEGELVVVTV